MPGLEPGIHVFLHSGCNDVDGRVKPGHDENLWPNRPHKAVNRRKNS
jgi:hypothetical protein